MINHNLNKRGYSRHLVCSELIKNLIVNECVDVFVEAHPELEGSKVTNNQILTSMVRVYLGQEKYYELIENYGKSNKPNNK